MAKRPVSYSPPEPVETMIDGKTYRGSFYVRDENVHVTGPGGACSGPVRIGLSSPYTMAHVALGELVMKAKLRGDSGIDADDE